MARITVEDCLQQISNRYALIHAAAKRARQLINGAQDLVEHDNNKPPVVALREIAASKVKVDFVDVHESEEKSESENVIPPDSH